MDWKILVGVLVFLLAFSIYRCTEDSSADFDKIQEQKKTERKKDYARAKSAEEQNDLKAKLEQAQKVRGKRPPTQIAVIENDLFTAEITTRGATIRSFKLKDPQYVEHPRDWSTGLTNEKGDLVPIDLVTTNPGETFWTGFPLRLHIYEGLEGLLPDADYEIMESTKRRAIFKYKQADQPVTIYKKFEIADDSQPYQLWLTIRIVNNSEDMVSFRPEVIQTGFQPEEEASSGMFAPQPNLLVGACLANGELFAEAWKDIDEPYTSTGVKFTGVGDNYFVSAMIPGDDYPTTCKISQDRSRVVRTELQWGEIDLKPGADIVLRVKNYMGPKKFRLLAAVGNNLERAVDYGIFAPICKVLLWLLFFFQSYVINWGVAIILLTVTIKLILIPLTNKSFKSSNAMKALKPEIDKINEKYKDNPQEKQKATMAMYKTKGVNPLGGCLPMVLQMPIWFALFRMLRSSPELYRAPFFGWITDLSNADPYFITPVVMGGMMFVQQRMMPMGSDNAQMKMMMYFMPIMFTVMMAFLPSGLTLYILVNTVLSIAHQWILKRKSESAAVPVQ